MFNFVCIFYSKTAVPDPSESPRVHAPDQDISGPTCHVLQVFFSFSQQNHLFIFRIRTVMKLAVARLVPEVQDLNGAVAILATATFPFGKNTQLDLFGCSKKSKPSKSMGKTWTKLIQTNDKTWPNSSSSSAGPPDTARSGPGTWTPLRDWRSNEHWKPTLRPWREHKAAGGAKA